MTILDEEIYTKGINFVNAVSRLLRESGQMTGELHFLGYQSYPLQIELLGFSPLRKTHRSEVLLNPQKLLKCNPIDIICVCYEKQISLFIEGPTYHVY